MKQQMEYDYSERLIAWMQLTVIVYLHSWCYISINIRGSGGSVPCVKLFTIGNSLIRNPGSALDYYNFFNSERVAETII